MDDRTKVEMQTVKDYLRAHRWQRISAAISKFMGFNVTILIILIPPTLLWVGFYLMDVELNIPGFALAYVGASMWINFIRRDR